MNRIVNILLTLVILLSSGCASSSATGSADKTVKSGGKDKVVEDLSVYRPKYETTEDAPVTRVEPTNHVNRKVAILMDTVASVNKNIKYAQGYRILAYNGSERQTVMNLRKSIARRVPEVKDYLTYQQPNFRLKVGDFFSRLEAQQVLNQVSDLIPNAQIVQDQINVK
ncbi:sporulation protein [Pontibacter sp. H259]|uniref:sporulation protein n=1 Tax=Pontibacter sp. H259 TaxID=3133421 RepID=UPI0030BEEEC1